MHHPATDTHSSFIPAVVSNIIMLCGGTSADGKSYWAYVCMLPNQAEMFYAARKRGMVSLEDYGTILEWGEGKEPSEEVRKRMTKQFGSPSDMEAALIKLIEQQGGTP